MNTVLVTGATGDLGKAIVWSLLRKGVGIKVAARAPEQVVPIPGVHAVRFAYDDPVSIRTGLNGADGMVLMAPPLDIRLPGMLNPVIELAAERGVEHIVFVSALGVDAQEESPLRAVEQHLIQSGVAYTIIRPNFYMENFASGYLAQSISNGGFSLPAGEGRTSYISVADVAEAIESAFVLGLRNRAFNLTGPEAIRSDEIAAIFSEALGRQVFFSPIEDNDMARMYESMGMPAQMLRYASMFFHAARNGISSRITSDVQDIVGRPPFPFESFVRVSVDKWR